MKHSRLIIAMMAVLLSLQVVKAQQFNLSPGPVDGKMSIGLKVSKPFFKKTEYGDEFSSTSGVYKVYGYFPLKNNWQINTEIPVVVSKTSDYNETGLGNLYVEVQKALGSSDQTWLAFGIYVPTIGSDKYLRQSMGIITDPFHFVQYSEGISIRSTFGYRLIEKPGPILGVDIGPDLFIPTYEDGDLELLLHYGIKGGYHFNAVAAWSELNGIMVITEDGALADRWINLLNFGVQLSRGTFRPGVFYGIHLDKDLREGTSGVLGINLQIVLN